MLKHARVRSTRLRPSVAAVAVTALAAGLWAPAQAFADPGNGKSLPTPTGLSMSPGPQNPGGLVCDSTGTGPYGWVGGTTDTGVTLGATVTGPADGVVRGWFDVHDDTASYPGTPVVHAPTAWAAPGSTVDYPVTGLMDGHLYDWQVTADNQGNDLSAPTTPCFFHVDRTPPSVTGVASTDFPAVGSGATSSKRFGQSGNNSGTVTVTAADPTPADGTASGPSCVVYALDAAVPVPATCGGPSAVAVSGGTAALTVTPPRWGTNTLSVVAVDNAGNTSQPVTYAFYVPDGSGSPHPGDVDGDGIPDVVTGDSAGNLVSYDFPPGGGTAAAPSIVSSAIQSPYNDGWTNYQTTHRGALHSSLVDDLFVHQPGDPELYLYENTGQSGTGNASRFSAAQSTTFDARPVCAGTCTGYNTSDWSSVTSMAALGPVDGLSVVNGQVTGNTSLLTVEGDNLWLYQTTSAMSLQTATLVSQGGWANMDLLSPGDVNGDGLPDLWVRDRTTGDVYQYVSARKPDGTFDLATDLAALGDSSTRTLIATGVTPAAYPTLSAAGDGSGTLWGRAADGSQWTWPGGSSSSGAFVLGAPLLFAAAPAAN